LKVVDAKTSEPKSDFPSLDVASYIEAGSTAIHIAREIPIDKLPPGSYRLEVQAADSAGKSTVWRTANFSVE
jgi:hypothetical protein